MPKLYTVPLCSFDEEKVHLQRYYTAAAIANNDLLNGVNDAVHQQENIYGKLMNVIGMSHYIFAIFAIGLYNVRTL